MIRGQELKHARELAGLTPEGVFQVLAITPPNLEKYENDELDPSPELLEKLRKLYLSTWLAK